MPPGFELTPELLVRQGQALRGLARALLGDEHAAEDVVQETWVACLRHPGELPERVSAWLGTVTRRMALRRVRGEARRDARERHAAAHERVEAAQQRSLEHEEALRAVTQALAALEEPFKTALLLRYHEERTPAEIARELDVPLATVKSRLARGLEKLRASLAHELGTERRGRALALLAGIRIGTAGSGSLIGGLVLGAKTKVAVAVVLACGLLFMLTRDEPRETTLARGADRPGEARAGTALDLGVDRADIDAEEQVETSGTREEVPGTSVEPTPLALPAEASYTQRLIGRIRDPEDLPVSGARILLAPAGLDFNQAAVSDEEGRFALEFASRRPDLGCAWKIQTNGEELGPGWIEFQAGGTSELDLSVGAESMSVLFASSGELEFVFGVQGSSFFGAELRLDGVHADGAPEMFVGPDGRRHFVDRWARGHCPGQETETILEDFHEFDSNFLSSVVRIEGINTFADGGAPPANPGAVSVRGIVRDAGGNPVPGAKVGYGPFGQALSAQVTCGEQGEFALENVPPGAWRLRAGGPAGEGRYDERVTIGAADFAWNPLLERGNELAGKLLLPDGKPAADAEVELWSRTSTRLQRLAVRTNEDGRFAFQALAEGEYELFLRSADGTLPVRVAGPFRAPLEVGTLTLEEHELVRHTLTVRPLGPEGEDLPGSVLRLWHEASGLALECRGLDEEGRLVCKSVPTGSYRIELGGPSGWRELGRQWIESDLDLGTVAFPKPALLWLEPGAGEEPRPLASMWRAHEDVLAQLEQGWPGRLARSANPGDYVLCLDDGSAAREVQLQLESGRTLARELEGVREPRPLSETPAAGPQTSCLACHASPGG